MKTPQEIARENLATIKKSPLALFGTDVAALIVEAIETDRAQRDLYELIAEALDERAEIMEDERFAKAAAAVRGEGDYQDVIWDMWIGPMLDQLERVYGE